MRKFYWLLFIPLTYVSAQEYEAAPIFSHLRCLAKGNERTLISGVCEYVENNEKPDPNFQKINCNLNTTRIQNNDSAKNTGSDTCYLANMLSGIQLKKVGKWRWASVREPQGTCLLNYVITLESKDGLDWTYSETLRSVGNNSKACEWAKLDLGKRYEYSNKGRNIFKMHCQYLELGIRPGLNIYSE